MSNPYQVLGIARDADDAAVRAAYLREVQLCPPDRDAERFAALRRAFDALATHRLRVANDLFDKEPPTLEGMVHLLESGFAPRRADTATLLRVLKGGSIGR
ncbi:DnaJ domain-containing protein [Propionivibrio sp.]|uniref:DnaJ domain-containing protein n=1 Tax=Propionivibrio sp. TaxID=2212460 RepID=UPI003BEFA10E